MNSSSTEFKYHTMSQRKTPIDYLTTEACGNLIITCDDDSDEENPDYYDETNDLPIDEEWHELFCYKCGYDREVELGKCMACEAEYINFFI